MHSYNRDFLAANVMLAALTLNVIIDSFTLDDGVIEAIHANGWPLTAQDRRRRLEPRPAIHQPADAVREF